jgi:hypothetical protein
MGRCQRDDENSEKAFNVKNRPLALLNEWPLAIHLIVIKLRMTHPPSFLSHFDFPPI